MTVWNIFEASTLLMKHRTLPEPNFLTHSGHGGDCCADYISKTIPQTLTHKLTENKGITVAENITSSFIEVDNSIIESLRDNFKSLLVWPMPKAMRQKAIDGKLQNGDVKKIALRARSGSTALLAVIEGDYITLANVGDCRAGSDLFFFK
jgi:serine/threonine protein phosphatase PrpC